MRVRDCIVCALAALSAAGCSLSPRASQHAAGGPRGESGFADPTDSLTCYLAQLHLHGHSNHNGNPLPASIGGHTHEAKRNGFDVIWWTDHTELFDGLADSKIDFASATIDGDSATVALGARPGRQVSSISIERPVAGARIRIEDRSLVASVIAEPDAEDFRIVRLTPASRLGRVRVIRFCRPVSSGLELDAWLGVEGFGGDTYVRFVFDFSWHPEGLHHARFDGIGSMPGKPVRTSDTTVVGQFTMPVAAGTGRDVATQVISIDLEKALSLLPDGTDNTLSSFSIEMGARKGRSISVRVDSLVIRSRHPAGVNQFAAVDSMSGTYAQRYGLRSYVGIEIGKIHTPQAPHMNAYLPAHAQSYDDLYLGWKEPRGRWIERVHESGGLISFNHPFGASRNPRGRSSEETDDYDDTSAAQSPRVLAVERESATEEEFWQVAGPLLEGGGLGADLLEVGYIYRGIGSLNDHLRLWDLALANGIRLVGTGTSDSHGGLWGPDMVPNPFGTWIWARTADAADLMKALRRGHAAFGDPFNFKSHFAFMAKDSKGHTAMMGDTLVVPAASEVTAWATFEPTPSNLDSLYVELLEVKMARGSLIDATRRPLSEWPYVTSVEAQDSCFVRLEVRATDGTPLVFSNPIYIFPEK